MRQLEKFPLAKLRRLNDERNPQELTNRGKSICQRPLFAQPYTKKLMCFQVNVFWRRIQSSLNLKAKKMKLNFDNYYSLY